MLAGKRGDDKEKKRRRRRSNREEEIKGYRMRGNQIDETKLARFK